MEGWLGFVLAGFALAGSPGPATLSLAAAGAAFGARRGLGYLAGIVLGMVFVMAIVAAGVTGLLLALPGAAPLVTVLAALYFAWLAWRIAIAPPVDARAGLGRPPAFLGGVALSLVNPKGYAAMAALFSGFALSPGRPALDAALKMAALVAVMLAVNVAWLQGGAALTRYFRRPVANRAINVAFALLLVASVLATLRL